jgi:hypothetical protein
VNGSSRPRLRRLALALAATQLVVFALAPVLEAMTERPATAGAVEAAHDGCVRVHRPATCMACILSSVRARVAAGVRVPVGTSITRFTDGAQPAAVPPFGPRHTPSSRAPPALTV